MKISTRVRYGVRMMVELGLHYEEGPFYLREIAKIEEISEKYLSQIIIPLKNSGLVNSFRGVRGGYLIARHPSKITMKEIVAVLEGDLSLVKCINDAAYCTRVATCVSRGLWNDLGETISQMLDSVTLEDLVAKCRYKKEAAVTYSI